MSGCDCEVEVKDKSQNKILMILLSINLFMFFLEFSVGWYAESTGLIADSIDMLADAIVYAISIYAIGKSLQDKAHAALLSGWFQMGLGILIVLDVIRRVFLGSETISILMISMGIIALIANVICLMLIQSQKSGEIHMRASWIFSKNDVIANTGVILAGIMVWFFDSNWPDLIIGALIALVIINGARLIMREAKVELHLDEKNT